MSLSAVKYCLLKAAAGGMTYGDLKHICRNDWVTRIWTIQEHILASKPIVMCGDFRATEKQFFTFLVLIPKQWASLYGPLPSLVNQAMDWWFIRAAAGVELRQFPTETNDLIVYLTSLSLLNGCLDPLDKVYALYSLLEDNFQHLPIVDYTRDKARLYEDFTRVTIESTEKFWPASLSWRKESVLTLPSWVPDMTAMSKYHSGWSILDLLFECPKAALDSKLSLQTLQTSKTGTIALKARPYTTIRKFVLRWPNFDMPTAKKLLYFHRHILFSWSSEGSDYPYNTRGGVFSPLGEFLTAEILLHNPKLAVSPLILTWIQKCFYSDLNEADEEDAYLRLRPQGLTDEDICGFIENITLSFADNFPFQTATGPFGRTLGRIEQGDTIALLAGNDFQQYSARKITIGATLHRPIFKIS